MASSYYENAREYQRPTSWSWSTPYLYTTGAYTTATLATWPERPDAIHQANRQPAVDPAALRRANIAAMANNPYYDNDNV